MRSTQKLPRIPGKISARMSFVIRLGILAWGCGSASIFVLLIWLLAPSVELKTLIVLSYVIFPILGAFWAADTWTQWEMESQDR